MKQKKSNYLKSPSETRLMPLMLKHQNMWNMGILRFSMAMGTHPSHIDSMILRYFTHHPSDMETSTCSILWSFPTKPCFHGKGCWIWTENLVISTMIKAAILEHVPRHVAPTTADLWWDRGTTDPRNLPSAMVYPVIVKDNYGKSSFFS